MATYYRWRKSTVQYTANEAHQSGRFYINGNTISPYTFYYSTEITITDDGRISLSGTINSVQITSLSGSWNTIEHFGVGDDVNYYFAMSRYNNSDNQVVYGLSSQITTGIGSEGTWVSYANTTDRYVTTIYVTAAPGTSQGYVYSTSSSAYPNGGVSGSYYYDQRTTVTSPTAPTGLTYPNPITTPTVTVSWNAATSNTDYPVKSYYVSAYYNGSLWETKSTSELSRNFTIPTTINGAPVTSAQYEFYSKDTNGQFSEHVKGPNVPVYLAPTLTVPQMVMQGQSATVSWTAIDGADSYTLQRKANTDAEWTQVYSGANLSYSETVGTWTSVQYRVQAVFSGTPGGWAESAAIPVVSSSALVISGTDGDLGTVVNDIPYSISTDTGNQITATITVNSAVIFSGNVGNSTSDTIPVLDLVNGEGTIVIEASVTASGGPVSAVRTWTYTKAPITFPNAGSVAQLTKEGENIFPKTLAGCVRLPGGKTLDEVTAFPCQVYTGSYVGTGTFGASNPNSLTFPFEPKVWGILTFPSAGGAQATSTNLIPWGITPVVIQSTSSVCAYDGNTVNFYNATSAANQCNTSGATYYYIALG